MQRSKLISQAVRSSTTPVTPPVVHLPLRHLFHPKSGFVEKQALPLPSDAFNVPLRRDILHSCVRSFLFSNRDGTIAHVKNRHEVNGSHRKQRPQKGTGHSRMGTKQSPLLVGGGQAHGPRNTRNWKRKVNKKVWALGMKVALSDKIRSGDLVAIPAPHIDIPRTNKLSRQLSNLKLLDRTLFISSDTLLHLASRNIPTIDTMTAEEVDVYDVLRSKKVVVDTQSLNALYTKIQIKAGEIEGDVAEPEEYGVETPSLSAQEEQALLDEADFVLDKQ
ncbi:hypothetical protein E3P99_02633 [Wallemia hederae]|uniref:Large ribosomal subunit protein uL4m n=1 Tax=Wallemia hederae TaxID=1540922 RepID=A0A4V4LSZ4_9BASI|nr:hypothetical protein E3P99_02633 [Wallemia hederae]